MYALGVVLIEIGLWQTVDQIFVTEIQTGHVPPTCVTKWWKRTGAAEVQCQMGEAFVEVVGYCLKGNKFPGKREDQAQGLIDMRDRVIDVLAQGIEL